MKCRYSTSCGVSRETPRRKLAAAKCKMFKKCNVVCRYEWYPYEFFQAKVYVLELIVRENIKNVTLFEMLLLNLKASPQRITRLTVGQINGRTDEQTDELTSVDS